MHNIDQFISTPWLEQLAHAGPIQGRMDIVDPDFLRPFGEVGGRECKERRGANELTPGQHAKF